MTKYVVGAIVYLFAVLMVIAVLTVDLLGSTLDDTVKLNSVEPEHELVMSIILQESAGNPIAVSNKGARGLMQVTDVAIQDVIANTWRLPKDCAKVTEDMNPFKESDNILIGTCYLQLCRRYIPHDMALAIMCYNAGPGRVADFLEGRVNLPAETRYYTRIILCRLSGRLRKQSLWSEVYCDNE